MIQKKYITYTEKIIMNKKITLIGITIYFCITSNVIYTMDTPYLNCFQDIYVLNTITTGISQESLDMRAAIDHSQRAAKFLNRIQRERLKDAQILAETSLNNTTTTSRIIIKYYYLFTKLVQYR